MRWCRCNKNKLKQLDNIDEINKLENCLKFKKEELLRTDRELRHKQKQLIELNSKAIKLKECKRKFSNLMVKCKKYDKKTKKKKKKKKAEPVDIIHNFFDNVFRMDKDMKKVAKLNKYDLLGNIRRILVQPNARPTVVQNKRRISNRERLFYAPKDCYLMSLQRTPQLWVYHRWPKFYPYFLDARAQWRNLGTCCMFLLGILFWVPCFVCLEILKCCFCSCCCDC